MRGNTKGGDAFWAGLALPGVVWLCIFFLSSLLRVLCVAFGTVDPILQTPIPAWNPLKLEHERVELRFQ